MISVEVRTRGENNADDVHAVTSTCSTFLFYHDSTMVSIIMRLIGINFHDSPTAVYWGLFTSEKISDGGIYSYLKL